MERNLANWEAAPANLSDKNVSQPQQGLTWGKHLTQEAQRILRRRVPTMPWLHALTKVMERVTSFSLPVEERFQRKELTPITFAGPVMHPAQSERGPDNADGELLAPDVHSRLQYTMGSSLPELRIHTDQQADRFARSYQADAVTVGQHLFFRQARYRPREDTGFALLAHEATHVVQAMRPGASWRRATEGGINEEEQEAQERERHSLIAPHPIQHQSQRPFGPSLPFNLPALERVPIQEAVATQSAVPRPMTASSDRAIEAVPTPSAPNIEELRQALYRDLMSQIKADFERGG